MIQFPDPSYPQAGDICVPPEGNPSTALVAFIGEAPGRNEVVEGQPFVGKSGWLFNQFLEEVEIHRPSQTYITNAFPFQLRKTIRKVGNKKVDFFWKGKILVWSQTEGFTEFGHRYKRALVEELKAFKGNVIVPLGNIALEALLDVSSITKWRGSVLWSTELGKKIIPTIHPAATFRKYLQRFPIKHDLHRIANDMTFPELRTPNPKLMINPTFQEASQFLQTIIDHHKKVSFDIESLIKQVQVSHIAFSISAQCAMSIPFFERGKNYWSTSQELSLWLLIEQILSNPKILKIGQNLIFDTTVIWNRYGIQTHNMEDTMIAHKTLLPEFPMGLNFITSTYTRHPYYKDEGKGQRQSRIDWDTYSRYNARDTIICHEVAPLIYSDLRVQNNEDAAREQTRLLEPMLYMSARGMRINETALKIVAKDTEEKINNLKEKLNSYVGYALNANSPQQVINHFYHHLRLKPYLEKKKPTSNDNALKRLLSRGYKEAGIILEIRQHSTLHSRYYSMNLKDFGDHKRFMYAYKPATKMARLSSTTDLFGYGTNSQNLPKHEMNKFFFADPGKLIGNVDLSQADAMSVAYIGNVLRMIKEIEQGLDGHTLLASSIFDIPPDEIKQMDKEDVPCKTIGNGTWTHRKIAKTCRHALNFDIGIDLFALTIEAPREQARFLMTKYFEMYPEIRTGYQANIVRQLELDRTITNCFGRKMQFFDRWGDQLFKKAYAAPAQSNTVEIINRWGLNEFWYNPEFKDVDLLRQVHDSINFQLPIDLGVDNMFALLVKMRRSLERPLRWKSREWIIPTDWSLGYDLSNQIYLDLSKSEETKQKLGELINENNRNTELHNRF